MCPLRVILIFLSATLAGFLLLKGIKSTPEIQNPNEKEGDSINPLQDSVPRSSKISSAICSGFWTSVDMASGRYLWRNLASSSSKYSSTSHQS